MKVTHTARIATATLLVAGLTSAALTGCAGTTPSATGSSTLTLWTDALRAPALKSVSAQFQKDTGVTIKLVIKDFATVDKDFISQVPTGKGPDIIVSPQDKLGAYVQNGVVAPIQLGDSASKYAKVAIQAVTYNGNVYGLPYSIENIAMVRNTDLAPTAAKTFDDVITTGKV